MVYVNVLNLTSCLLEWNERIIRNHIWKNHILDPAEEIQEYLQMGFLKEISVETSDSSWQWNYTKGPN